MANNITCDTSYENYYAPHNYSKNLLLSTRNGLMKDIITFDSGTDDVDVKCKI